MEFELAGLDSYDIDALRAEMRRVAALLPAGPITKKAFDALAQVSSCTLVRRFGDWHAALLKAETRRPLQRSVRVHQDATPGSAIPW